MTSKASEMLHDRLRKQGDSISISPTKAPGVGLPIPPQITQRDLNDLNAIALRTIHSVTPLPIIQFSMFTRLLYPTSPRLSNRG
jgi:hypothetical protein